MYKVFFDYGHGGVDPGAVNGDRKESNDNLLIGMAIAAELRKERVEVKESRVRDITLSPRERSSLANQQGYNFFISFHRNAAVDPSANGAEVFIYSHTKSTTSRPLAEAIQKAMVEVGFRNRGVKASGFHVLRATKAPAVLIELGFISNTLDNTLFDGKRNEIIKGIAGAILGQLKETKNIIDDGKNVLFRVQIGAFGNKENAERLKEEAKRKGFNAVVVRQ